MKTLNLKNEDVFVKENYSLTRERVSVFTQIASDANMKLPDEFVFKGAGKRVRLDPPENAYAQWAEKGSFRLEHMLEVIERLPDRSNPFNVQTGEGFAIYVLDDYAVHLMPEIKEALLKRGYILVVIGGGVTGNNCFPFQKPGVNIFPFKNGP